MKLQLHEWGGAESPPVVCLHGVTAHGARFARLAELLPRFRVLAPDLRGHGRSTWEPPWRLETHVDDVLETADAAGVGSADWIGHSFGGRLLLELAACAPERVKRTVLLDPVIRIRPDDALRAADAVRCERIFETRAEAVPLQLTGPLRHTPPELLELEREQHLEAVGDGFRWRFSRSAAVAILGELAVPAPALGQLHAPALLVLGADRSVVDASQLERFRRALGERLRVTTVPGGHNVLWDALAETAAAVSAFLDEA